VSLPAQNKELEIAFFDAHADATMSSILGDGAVYKLIDAFEHYTTLLPGSLVVDLGCGSGRFTALLCEKGYKAEGLDLSPHLLARARQAYPAIRFTQGDVEALPFPDQTFDGVLMSALVHHLPDPTLCAREVYRILKPGGRFLAFDPNRRNPFMYLYRDPSSPFYSPIGVTKNERPIIPGRVAAAFRNAGLTAKTAYLGGLSFRFIASGRMQPMLPLYNALDAVLSRPALLAPLRPFVLTYGNRD
jgi:SAM-dependent methyltransferase